MGLDCSHGAFNGAYSAFNRLRQGMAEAIGGSFPPHKDKSLDNSFIYFDDEVYSLENKKGLWEFFNHSDCDGEIAPEMCLVLAKELEEILPLIDDIFLGDNDAGHLERVGGISGATRNFINGCKLAHERGESLLFK